MTALALKPQQLNWGEPDLHIVSTPPEPEPEQVAEYRQRFKIRSWVNLRDRSGFRMPWYVLGCFARGAENVYALQYENALVWKTETELAAQNFEAIPPAPDHTAGRLVAENPREPEVAVKEIVVREDVLMACEARRANDRTAFYTALTMAQRCGLSCSAFMDAVLNEENRRARAREGVLHEQRFATALG